tara:strand:+ start:155355 stop:156506 length:1152 start_codon:yes stop_codon:yes gene_type:complete
MKKICVFTGTRAEYGLLKPLIKKFNHDKSIELQIVVSGMHLSPEFGMTVNEIEEDGFSISDRIEILLSSDSPVGISKSMGLGLISFSESLQRLKPDLVVILGDRFESFSFASACMISRVPIAHLNGGEATYGLIDEPIRHSITKMSHLHFTATEEFKNRVIQLGEHPKNVYNTGSIGLDNVKDIDYLSKEEVEKTLDFTFKEKNLLVTFHPVTLDHSSAEDQITELLSALAKYTNYGVIFTKGNADTDGRIINSKIDDFVSTYKNAKAFNSLGLTRYLSCLKIVDAVIGNSSSGIIEVPSFKIGTVNIGDRQKGRIFADSVVNCPPNSKEIQSSMEKVLSTSFKEGLKDLSNPYEKSNTAEEIYKIIKAQNLQGIIKKEFHNL